MDTPQYSIKMHKTVKALVHTVLQAIENDDAVRFCSRYELTLVVFIDRV